MHVFLDTEPLKRDPWRRSGPFHALTLLAATGKLTLHLSDLSISEFLTWQEGLVKEAAAKAIRALKDLERVAEVEIRGDEGLATTLSAIAEQACAEIETRLREWIDQARVTVHRIGPQHAEWVFRDYFAGAPPFRKEKARTDLPDAFIWRQVTELAKEVSNVVFVSGDQALRAEIAKARQDGGVSYCSSVEELVETGDLPNSLREGLRESQIDLIREVFSPWAESSERVTGLVAGSIRGRTALFFYPVEGDYEIQEVLEIARLLIEGTPRHYGDGLLAFEFSGRALCRLALFVSPTHAASIPRGIPAALSETSDGGVTVTIPRTLVIRGTLLVQLTPTLLGSLVPQEAIVRALDGADVVVDAVQFDRQTGGGVFPHDVYHRHAAEAALAEIAAGNLETDLDGHEEADRHARARWVPIPESLHGTHGKFVLGKDSSLKIAPQPRFEQWVRVLKRLIIERKRDGESQPAAR